MSNEDFNIPAELAKLPCSPELARGIADYAVKIRTLLGDNLVGVYLYGSLVGQGYHPGVSDVDMIAGTRTIVTMSNSFRSGNQYINSL